MKTLALLLLVTSVFASNAVADYVDTFTSDTSLNPAFWTNITGSAGTTYAVNGSPATFSSTEGLQMTASTWDSVHNKSQLLLPYYRGLAGTGVAAPGPNSYVQFSETFQFATSMPAGLDLTMWGKATNFSTTDESAINFEVISGQYNSYSVGSPSAYAVLLSAYQDYNPSAAPGTLGNTTANHVNFEYEPSSGPILDFSNWTTFMMRWYQSHTDFYINGNFVWSSASAGTANPTANLMPTLDIGLATYNGTIAPAASPADNINYVMDVQNFAFTTTPECDSFTLIAMATLGFFAVRRRHPMGVHASN